MGEEGTRRALLIGINDYERLPRLRGAVNDVETIRALLVTQFGFARGDVTLLTDGEATRAGILAAFEKLVTEAGRADTVYVHYSGHGSQVRDANGDESDGLDETICPQDARQPGIADITDDELDAIIDRLNVAAAVVVLDSCHSGTGLRDAAVDIRTRFVPPDDRLDLYALATRAIVPLPLSERYLLFTGAAANQSALDGPFDGRYHGLFTLALARGLSGAPQGVTPRGLMARVERALQTLKPALGGRMLPEPQLEGAEDRLDQPLFSGTPAPATVAAAPPARVPWVEVERDGPAHRLLDGARLGGRPGSIWAVYPRGETRFAPGQGLRRLVVTETVAADALARPVGTGAEVRAGSRAILIAPSPPPDRVPILLRSVADEIRDGLERELEARLGQSITFVAPGQFARFVIDCTGESERWNCAILGAQGESRLATLEAAPASVVESLAFEISRSMAVAALLSLENPASRLRVELGAAGATPRSVRRIGTRGIRVSAALAPQPLRFFAVGERRTAANSLQLELRASEDCYLTIVDVDARGATSLLFPTEHVSAEFLPDGLVRAGDRILLPDSLEPRNRAGFYFDYGPPEGLDTVSAICATRLEDAERVRHAVRAVARGDATAASGLLQLRQDLSAGVTQATTGASPDGADGETLVPASRDWAASSITLIVSAD
ncbi:MAG: caspase family protein [Myxococcota bacterium]